MAKWTATESAQQVIDDAVQLFGALGVTRGQTVERLYREIRALRIYEGATDVQKLIVARELLRRLKREETMAYTAHVDTFARDNLPPREQWPEFIFELPELQYPERHELRDGAARSRGRARLGRPDRDPRAGRAALDLRRSPRAREPHRPRAGRGSRPRPRQPRAAARAEQPDARGVLVRGDEGRRHRGRARCRCCARRSSPTSITKARVSHALCDARLAAELDAARPACPTLTTVALFGIRPAGGTRRAGGGQARDLRQRRHGGRRHRAHRVHVGDDRQAEGHDAFPPRRDRGLRLLSALDAARLARRSLHRQPAARVHVRTGRAAALSAVDRRGDAARRAAGARGAAARDRPASRQRALHGADVVPRDGGGGEEPRPVVAARSACRRARRFRRRPASCGRTRPASR